MTEEEWVKAILADPDNDVPRVAYADWLEKHGQTERGEFIRVQCTLASLPENHPQIGELAAREESLLDRHADEWLKLLEGMIDGWVFHRGMLGVVVSVPQFLAHGESLTHSPLVHYIDIADHAVGRANVQALALLPFLRRVTSLDLAGWYCYDADTDLVDEDQAAQLAGSPYVDHLTSLNLRCNRIGGSGVRALALSTNLSRLTELDLRANPFGDDGLLALASSPWFRQLRRLDLAYDDGKGRTEAGWQALVAAPGLDQLQELYLAGNQISDQIQAAFRARLGESVQF